MATSPYDEIYNLIQDSKPEPDEAQLERNRKIARVNTIGEGLKGLFDIVGGASGANVQKREVSPVLLKSVNDYNKQRMQDAADESKWNNLNLNAHLKGIAYQDQQAKEAQNQANYNSKLGAEATKIAQTEADKQKQRDFQATEWEKNRQNRLKAAAISHSPKTPTTKNWQDKPDYTFYDQQTGQHVPMMNGDVDQIIGDMRSDPQFQGQMNTLDNLIKIDPPKAKEEKRRLVQQYGNQYRDKILAMSHNQPYSTPAPQNNVPQTLLSNTFNAGNYNTPTQQTISEPKQAVGNTTPVQITQPDGSVKSIQMDPSKLGQIQGDLQDIHNDQSLDDMHKRVKMHKTLVQKYGMDPVDAKNIIISNY